MTPGKSFTFIFLLQFLLPACQQTHRDQIKSDSEATLALNARSQITNQQKVSEEHFDTLVWKPSETAIIICDMWDVHWCDSATKRVAAMAPKINEMIIDARNKGVTIVHAPSGTIDFYKEHPARQRVLTAPFAKPPIPIQPWYHLDSLSEGPLPVDDTDEGCDAPNNSPKGVWKRQISSIRIDDKDIISDDGQEIYNYFAQQGIRNVAICGVHTNMCVLGRSFGIRGQTKAGKNVVLIRDMTDSMYNPEMPPYVSHAEGTEKIVEHIETYWCPSILSSDFMKPS
ncbi:MAG: protein-signal peptide and transmembrane prediction [Cyclobacteriaceae bacterium]